MIFINKRNMLLLGIGIIAISTSAAIVIQKNRLQRANSIKPENSLIELNEEYGINTKDYEILWAEDFNTDVLDETKWEYELGSIRGIEQQHYVNNPENVFIRNNENGSPDGKEDYKFDRRSVKLTIKKKDINNN